MARNNEGGNLEGLKMNKRKDCEDDVKVSVKSFTSHHIDCEVNS